MQTNYFSKREIVLPHTHICMLFDTSFVDCEGVHDYISLRKSLLLEKLCAFTKLNLTACSDEGTIELP